MKKLVLSLLILLTIVAVPQVLASKSDDSQPQTETVILSKSNLLLLNSEVDSDSVSAVISAAKALDNSLSSKIFGKNKKPFYLFMNTPGGSVQSGLELIEALKGIGRPVNTVTLFAASMGFQIVQNMDDRLILKNGILMSHHAAGKMEGNFGGVHPSQMENRYQLWLDRVRELDEQTVRRTNGKQTYESYTKQYDQEMWLTGTKSVVQGYADRIVMVKCDSTLSGVTTKTTNFMGLDISYDLDNCPINTGAMNVRISSSEVKGINPEIEKDVKAKFIAQFEDKEKQVVTTY